MTDSASNYAPPASKDTPGPEPRYEPPAPKGKHDRKPAADNQGAQLAKTPAPSPKVRVTNSTYVNALHHVDVYFRQQGELAQLVGAAADRGLAAFKTRTSHEYNKSSHLLMELFQAAINIIPGGAVLKSAFDELRTGEKLFRLVKTVKAVSAIQEGVQHVQTLKEALEPAKSLYEAGEAAAAVGERRHEVAQSRRQGDFEIQALQNLGEMTATQIATLWSRENFMDKLLQPLQFAAEDLDLLDMTSRMLGSLPEPASLAADLAQAAESFEIELYLQFYLEEGQVTYVTTERDDVAVHQFRGLPPAVEERLRSTNNMSRVLADPRLKHEHHVHRFEGMKV